RRSVSGFDRTPSSYAHVGGLCCFVGGHRPSVRRGVRHPNWEEATWLSSSDIQSTAGAGRGRRTNQPPPPAGWRWPCWATSGSMRRTRARILAGKAPRLETKALEYLVG